LSFLNLLSASNDHCWPALSFTQRSATIGPRLTKSPGSAMHRSLSGCRSEIVAATGRIDAPNGIGLSPDGATLHFAETLAGRSYRRAITGPGGSSTTATTKRPRWSAACPVWSCSTRWPSPPTAASAPAP
jgi:hypothetical protein